MPSPYRPVLRHPVLRRVLPGFAVSAIGDGMSLVGIAWLALDLAPAGQGPAWVSVAMAAYTLPSALGVVAFGRFLRGRPSAQLGLWDAGLRAVTLGAIPVLYLFGALSLPAYVALLGAASLLHSWGQAGRYTLLTELLAERDRLAGNALLSMFTEGGGLIGPALAGVVIATAGAPAVLAVDAATFAVMAGSFLVGVPADLRRPVEAARRAQAAGWRVIRSDGRLLGLLAMTFLFFALYGPVEVALPVHVADELHAPATLLATYFTVFGIGAFAGALLAGYLKTPMWPTTVAIVLGWGLCLLPLGLGAPTAVSMVALAVGGLIWAPFPAASTVLFQQSTTTELLPQVLAAQGGVLVLAFPLGTLAGGPLVTVFGGRGTIALSALGTVALGILAAALATRPLRSATRQHGQTAFQHGATRHREKERAMAEKQGFTAAPPRLDLPAIDHSVLELWRESDIFRRSLAQTEGGPRWIFYEGPPTANGRPGVHHVEPRTFKDVFPRYRTMKGYHVPRRAGWDCHGLPVEIAVEKELGLNGKKDIERVGIAAFNARCRESVQRHVDEFTTMTERLGYWVDMSAAYWTMDAGYVDSVWWALRQIFDRGLLAEDHRVAPYCPRCGTGLSDHEVAQGYETVTDPSVYVRLPAAGPVAGVDGVELLVWTTTPWTLVSNTAVAVHPDVTYAVARTDKGTFVVAEPLVRAALGEGAEVLATLAGRELEHLGYARAFELVDIPGAHYVVLADYVTTQDGTGLVHQAPAFGADDLATVRGYGMPVVNPVGPDGRFLPTVDLVGGVFFKDADAILVKDLERRGLLLRAEPYEHSYPHCWRCHTPLMYYAQLSWYIRTTRVRDELLRENERTRWYPEHIKHGRYGDWLENNIDWALSRNRYWGTPLPLWRCAEGHLTCAQSRAELGTLAGRDLSTLDPHRPFIDEVTFPCPSCGATATRVPEVIDAWFDSGSMPFAQLGYPFAEGSAEAFAKAYPAQFICEAIDQTRGWFYTLMAIGTLAFDRSAYETVVVLGHIVAEDGRKMSKHLGNILEPIPLMERHGADALRWFMATSGSPWVSRRIGDATLDEIVRRVLLTYWNTVSFLTLYASASNWTPGPVAEPSPLDRWLRAELHHLAGAVDAAMEDFDTAGAGRLLGQFVDDLSNWYVRLSRQRFWAGDPAALSTLYETIEVLTRLLAPFIPFLTEHVWQVAVRPGSPDAPESVHLATWPATAGAADDTLRAQMATVRALVEAGRAARKASGLRVRQPLGRGLVGVPGEPLPAELLAYVADELNVRELAGLHAAGEVLDVTVKPNFRALGKRFGSRTQAVARAIAAADPATLAAGGVAVLVDGEEVSLEPDDVLVTQAPRSGWAVAGQRDVLVALDTTITPELRRAGLAREVVRLVQEARKRADLAITDRIGLVWSGGPEVAEAVREHGPEIADAVLATAVTEADPGPDATVEDELDFRFHLEPATGGNQTAP